MVEPADTAGALRRPPAPGRDPARALVAWWVLAGVDQPVASCPRPWTARPPTPARPPAQPRTSPPFATVEALRAHLTSPGRTLPFSDGNPESGFVLVGEGPSAEDLRTGRPFSGPAGRLLDRMLEAIGRDRRSAYITLLAPRARMAGPPSDGEIEDDLPFTLRHLALLQPRLVLLLGSRAASLLSGRREPISALRGEPLAVATDARTLPALATFNPAYLLRRPEAKPLAWADLLEVKRRLA